ncbi:MAG: DUF523 and DUF1722 domain-containing protein [Caldisericia bacterium]|nr:DUF523 and DUF1722 domain-containing protein [Caldisericia bacterium]
MKNAVPKIGVSKCLTFDACRYDGQMIPSEFIERMKPFLDFVPVCPEVSVGLGVPRKATRLVFNEDRYSMVQPALEKDCTQDMEEFLNSWLQDHPDLDGFLLKSRSPSCGIKDVRLYPTMNSQSTIGKGIGYFPHKIQQIYPHLVIEDEGRMNNARIREHFFTRIYLQNAFCEFSTKYTISSLVQFHTVHKYLFMAYRPSVLQKMGQLVAHAKKMPNEDVLSSYQGYITEVFSTLPRTPSIINALQHCFGYVSDKLSSQERSYFLKQIQHYKEKRIPLSALLSLMKSWIVRFQEPYLLEQRLFDPYPEELMDVQDSGKGND